MLHGIIIIYDKMLNKYLLKKAPVRYLDAIDLWVNILKTERILTWFCSKLQIQDAMFWPLLLACTSVVGEKLAHDLTPTLQKHNYCEILDNFISNLGDELTLDQKEDNIHYTQLRIVLGEIGVTRQSKELFKIFMDDIEEKRSGSNKRFLIPSRIYKRVRSLIKLSAHGFQFAHLN